MSLYSAPLPSSGKRGQAITFDWKQLFRNWLTGQFPAKQDIPSYLGARLSPKIVDWPLACIFLGQAHRQYQFPQMAVRPVYQVLADSVKHLIAERWEEESGLLFLTSSEESLVPDSDFWQMKVDNKVADPSFMALAIHALENLIELGGLLKENIQDLCQYYELLTYSANEHLWNDEYGIYFPYDLNENQQIVSESIAGLLFWMADVPDQDQAEAMYRTLANNFVHPQHYYFPTSCVMENGQIRSVNFLINYLLFFGLTRFEFRSTAKALRQHSQYLIEESGSREVFDSQRHPDEKNKSLEEDAFTEQLWRTLQKAQLLHYSNLD